MIMSNFANAFFRSFLPCISLKHSNCKMFTLVNWPCWAQGGVISRIKPTKLRLLQSRNDKPLLFPTIFRDVISVFSYVAHAIALCLEILCFDDICTCDVWSRYSY